MASTATNLKQKFVKIVSKKNFFLNDLIRFMILVYLHDILIMMGIKQYRMKTEEYVETHIITLGAHSS